MNSGVWAAAVLTLAAICILSGCATSGNTSDSENLLLQAQRESPLPCTKKTAKRVSLVRLLANPEKMDGKCVRTFGVLAVAFEGTGVYLNRASYRLLIQANGLGLLPKGRSGSTWDRLDGEYVSVTGVFDGSSYGRWPSGLLKKVLRITWADKQVPPFSAVHTTVNLTDSEAFGLGEVLKSFSHKHDFRFNSGTFKNHGRRIQSFVLRSKGITIGVVNRTGPNSYHIDISNTIPWANWKEVQKNLTSTLHASFGEGVKIEWSTSHKDKSSGLDPE